MTALFCVAGASSTSHEDDKALLINGHFGCTFVYDAGYWKWKFRVLGVPVGTCMACGDFFIDLSVWS